MATIQEMKQKKKGTDIRMRWCLCCQESPWEQCRKYSQEQRHIRIYETLQALEKAFKDENITGEYGRGKSKQYNADRISEGDSVPSESRRIMLDESCAAG